MQGPKTTLTWKTYTATDDEQGGESFVWAKKKDLIGTLTVVTDRDRMMYGKKAESADYKFIVDYHLAIVASSGTSTEIDTADRLYLGSRVLEIEGKENPMMQNRILILFLSEAVNG